MGEPRQRDIAHKVKKTLTKSIKGILNDQLVFLKNSKHEEMHYDGWRRCSKLKEKSV